VIAPRLLLRIGVAATFMWPGTSTYADECKEITCTSNDSSLLLASQVLALPSGPVTPGSLQVYDYGTAPYCGGDLPDAPGGVECTLMSVFCRDKAGPGPAVWVLRRAINPDTPYVRVGYTCYPNLVPGKLDLAAIANVFHRTPLAAAQLKMQPPGGQTLVTLPNFFQVSWPEAGFQPEELDTLNPADWFGMHITLKPELNSVTYTFGDGTSIGPTLSLGGPYPSGDITKTYEAAGDYQVKADVVYKGYVSVDGSDWIEIPGTVDIAGTPQTISVKTAKNSLYLP